MMTCQCSLRYWNPQASVDRQPHIPLWLPERMPGQQFPCVVPLHVPAHGTAAPWVSLTMRRLHIGAVRVKRLRFGGLQYRTAPRLQATQCHEICIDCAPTSPCPLNRQTLMCSRRGHTRC